VEVVELLLQELTLVLLQLLEMVEQAQQIQLMDHQQ